MIGLACSKAITVGVRLYLGRIIIGFSFWYWVRTVFCPIVMLVVIVMGVGILPRFYMGASFLRIVVTTTCCELALLPLVWFLVMSREEKDYFSVRVLSRFAFRWQRT